MRRNNQGIAGFYETLIQEEKKDLSSSESILRMSIVRKMSPGIIAALKDEVARSDSRLTMLEGKRKKYLLLAKVEKTGGSDGLETVSHQGNGQEQQPFSTRGRAV